MKCPVCGSEQPVGMAYCDQCGSPLDAADTAAGGAPASAVGASPAAPPSPAAAAPASPPPAPQEAPLSEQSQAAPAAMATGGQGTVTAPDSGTLAAAPSDATGESLVFKFPSGGQFAPSTDVTNIGRADAAQDWHPELDVIPYGGGVPEMGVSRHHARLVRQDGKYMLMDVGSTNGTYVNGTALEYNKAAELKDGDTVAFGAFSMQVVLR